MDRGSRWVALAWASSISACSPGAGTASTAGAPMDATDGRDASADADSTDGSSASDRFVLRGGRLPGGDLVDVEIRDGRIVAVGIVDEDAPSVDVRGRWLAPAFIDSHVHLAYLPMVPEMVAGGIVAAVDMAAPEGFLAQDHAPIKLIAAGPMITSPGGYPLDSWGSDGFGLGCVDVMTCSDAVDHLKAAGAGFVKVPLTDPPDLDDALVAVIVGRAHALGLKVAVHALSENAARRGGLAGADILAHMPVEALTDETLAMWSRRTAVTTLAAFGGPAALDNTRRLRDAGCTILYGTDFGNTTMVGIDPVEIDQLAAAGFDGASILAMGTSGPAGFWAFDDLGAIAPGKAASLLVLSDDPLLAPATLATPLAVYVDGRRVFPP